MRLLLCLLFSAPTLCFASGGSGLNTPAPVLSTVTGTGYSIFSMCFTGTQTGDPVFIGRLPKSRASYSVKQVPGLAGTWTLKIATSMDGTVWNSSDSTQTNQGFDGKTQVLNILYGPWFRWELTACTNCWTNPITSTVFMEGW